MNLRDLIIPQPAEDRVHDESGDHNNDAHQSSRFPNVDVQWSDKGIHNPAAGGSESTIGIGHDYEDRSSAGVAHQTTQRPYHLDFRRPAGVAGNNVD